MWRAGQLEEQHVRLAAADFVLADWMHQRVIVLVPLCRVWVLTEGSVMARGQRSGVVGHSIQTIPSGCLFG